MLLRRRNWLVIPLAIAIAWLGYRCVAGGSDAPGARPEGADHEVEVRGHMVFRDGKWVRVSQDELVLLMRELANRTPGLVRVSGTVRETRSRQPVAGAEVVFSSELGESSALADDSGSYTIEVRPGFYRAFARADGYVAVGLAPIERLPQRPDASLAGMPRNELAPLIGVFRDQAGVDMQLFAGAVIAGTVYDAAGRPIAGAVITARLRDYGTSRIRLVLGTDMDESDLDGSFRLQVPAGPIAIQAVHDDYAGLKSSERQTLFLSPGQTERIDLTMAAGCIITGQVVDARGHPVAEGSLEQANGNPPPNDFTPVGTLDASGRFRLARMPAELRENRDPIRLRAWPWKSPPTEAIEFPCDDGARNEVTLVVPEAEPDLEGIVQSRDGERLSAAYIDLIPLEPGGIAQQERADRYGEWAFYSVPPGRYQVTAYVPGRGIAAHAVTAPLLSVASGSLRSASPPRRNAPVDNIRLTLGGTGAIAGAVEGMQEGSFTFLVEHCAMQTQDGSMAVFDEYSMPQATRIVAVESGEFYIDDLPACPLRALIRTPYRTQRVDVELPAGGVAHLSLDLRQAREKTLYGVVTDSDLAPAAEVNVSRLAGSGTPLDHYSFTVTDADGRYEIRAYTGDTLFFRSSRGWGEARVSWDEGERERIDLTLRD